MLQSPSPSQPATAISWMHAAAVALTIFGLGLFGMYSATLLRNRGGLVSLGNMFACGILLGAACIHQIPPAVEILAPVSDYPISGTIIGGTFILLLLVEEIVHIYTHEDTGHLHEPLLLSPGSSIDGSNHHDPARCQVHIHTHTTHSHNTRSIPSSPAPLGHAHGHSHTHHARSIPSSPEPNNHHQEDRHSHTHHARSIPSSPEPNNHHQKDRPPHHHAAATAAPPHAHTKHTHAQHLDLHLSSSWYAGIMLFFTLDIHSVFAGISVGVELSNFPLLIALCVHKFSAGFALGATFCTINVQRHQYVVYAICFSLCAPIGVVYGWYMSVNNLANNTTFGVVYSAVAGTFLYIGIMELGVKELLICRDDPHGSGVLIGLEKWKLVFLVIGYAVMAMLAIWL